MTTDATDFDSNKDLLDNARAIQVMPAFIRWTEVVKAQIQERMKRGVNEMGSVDDAFKRNYQNGEVAGLMLAQTLWSAMIEAYETEITRNKENTDETAV